MRTPEHWITETARQPLKYRTKCGKIVTRDQGRYVYTQADRQALPCAECRGEA